MKWSWKLCSIMGIAVRLHLTFLLLLILIYFAGASVIGVGGLAGVIFVLLVFCSVVVHEFSHALVARHFGIEVLDVTLLPIGGVARMARLPERPIEEILIALAGPSASFVLAFCLWFISDMMETRFNLTDLSEDSSLLADLIRVNLVLGLFNLLPAFPMDGGRVLRGVLALSLPMHKATRIAVSVGQILAIGLFFLGVLWLNLFMVLIALFIYMGAEAEERQMGVVISLGKATAKRAMAFDVEVLRPTQTVGRAAEFYTRGFQADFPVVDERRLIGLLTRESIIAALHQDGPDVLVGQIMIRDFPVAFEDTPLIEILEKMQATGYNAVPILQAGELRGLITLEQIIRYNMICSGLACEPCLSGKTDPYSSRSV